MFVVKSRRDVKVIHDKLKKCEAQKLSLLVMEYRKLLLSEVLSTDHADSINGLDGDEDSVFGGTSSEKEASSPRRPYTGTRSRNKAANESAGSECPKQRKENSNKKSHCCV